MADAGRPTGRAAGGRFPGGRICAHPGCTAPGEYRAPVERPPSAFAPPAGPPRWQYLCLEHVRAFNAAWNWFEGMTAEEIFAAQSPYPRFAPGPERRRPAARVRLDDPLGLFGTAPAAERPRLPAEERRALAVLGLAETATLAEVKRRYRALVRRYHPDANAGDRRFEPRLLEVRAAHDLLVRSRSFAGR